MPNGTLSMVGFSSATVVSHYNMALYVIMGLCITRDVVCAMHLVWRSRNTVVPHTSFFREGGGASCYMENI